MDPFFFDLTAALGSLRHTSLAGARQRRDALASQRVN